MKFRDYFFGQLVKLRSMLRPDAVAERIRANVKRWFVPPFYTGPVGGLSFGRLRLRYVGSFGEYNAKPVLVGTIDGAAAGSVLNLTYRGPTWGRLFDVFWYLFLAAFSVTLLVAGTNPPLHGPERLIPFAGIAIMAAFPIALHIWGTKNSDDELAALIEFLEQVAEARPEPDWKRD